MTDLSQSYINKKYGNIYRPEIDAGRVARDKYYGDQGISQDAAIREDLKPAISYVGQKGQVSTDEPSQEPMDSESSRDLMRKPIYESLLNRNPSSEKSQLIDNTPIKYEDMITEGNLPQEKQNLNTSFKDTSGQPQSTSRQIQQGNNATGDMMVGASHALLALLSGNANRSVMEYGKGNEFLEGQRKQDLANASNLVKTVGPNGQPIYTPAIEAADMQAYVKPVSAKESGKGYAPQKIVNKKNNEIQSASWNGKSFVQYDKDGNVSRQFDPNEWVGYIAPKYQSSNTMQGGKNLDVINPYTGNVSRKINTPGRGSMMGGITKEEYDITTKGAAKGRDILAKTDQDIASTTEAQRTLKTTKDPMTFSTTMGSLLRTAVGEKRLSDEEGRRYMGDDYKGFMLRGEEYLKSKYGGEIPDTVRQNAINLVDYVNSKLQVQRSATAKSYGGAPSLSPKGKATVKKILGTEEDKLKTDWRSKYGL